MAYSTVKALRMVLAPGLPDGGVEQPSERTNTAADLSNDELTEAIAEADAMIDAALGQRYATPVRPDQIGPLAFWSRNLAAYLATLTHRGSADFADTDPIFRRYATTQRFLDAVAKGDYTLPIDGQPSPTIGGGSSGPINPTVGPLFDGSDLDLSPGWGNGWPYDGHGYGRSPIVHPLLNPLEASTDFFEALQRGLEGQ